jgi:hypothetical protein
MPCDRWDNPPVELLVVVEHQAADAVREAAELSEELVAPLRVLLDDRKLGLAERPWLLQISSERGKSKNGRTDRQGGTAGERHEAVPRDDDARRREPVERQQRRHH